MTAVFDLSQGMVTDDPNLAERLRFARERAGLTQAQAAAAVRVDPQTISRWERGDRQPRAPVLSLLLEVYRKTAETGQVPRVYPDDPEPRPARSAPGIEGDPEPPRLLKHHAVRVWLADFRLKLTKAAVPDEAIEEAMALLTAPQVFTFYKGGAPRDFSEEDVITGMEAVASVVLAELKKRGYKVR